MIIADYGFAAVPHLPFCRDQCGRINLEMADRIFGDILRGTLATHPAITAK